MDKRLLVEVEGKLRHKIIMRAAKKEASIRSVVEPILAKEFNYKLKNNTKEKDNA